MKIIKLVFLSLLLFAGCNGQSVGRGAGDITFVRNNKTDYVIVTAVNASDSERHAAVELAKFLKEISGADFPVITDEQPLGEHEIILGANEHLKKLGIQIDFGKLGHEGFAIKTFGNYLVIAGGRLRGTMYGVYTLLEDYLGCRWFSSKVSRIPKQPNLKLAPMDISMVPALEYREPFYTDAFDGDWAARNRMNSSRAGLDNQRGGKITYYPFVHSFYAILPPQEYFEKHPEYYSELNGKRFFESGQLCLTNPDVLKLTIEKVEEWLKANPGVNIVSVSQNDSGGWCQCANCLAIDENEGSPAGTIVSFVNKVAEAIENEYPDVAIDTLAYQYSRTPPKNIKPRHNVIVRLCSIECCFTHPLDSCPENAAFVNDLKAWAKICNRLYIWDYVTNFTHYVMPFPNFASLAPNTRLFTSNNVKGIFEEGNYSEGGGGEFAELRAYVLAKLLWNPEYDAQKAINEFMDVYYGKSAPAIRKYFDLIHDKVKKDNIHLGIFSPPSSGHLTEDVINSAVECFDEAEELVDNEEIAKRVRLARLPLIYAQLVLAPHGKRDPKLIERFVQITKESGVTNVSEWGDKNIEQFRQALEIPRPFIGVQLKPYNEKGVVGVKIELVYKDYPAEKAGLKADDVIVSFNNQPVKSVEELVEVIRGCKAGDEIPVKVLRYGKEIELKVTIGVAPLY
ncbi:MAG: DUF4838 domain-containing protein [Planctomycetes bacterium]|nr:DUF4838 domain-containing protein [Planctomycetota bacterium]